MRSKRIEVDDVYVYQKRRPFEGGAVFVERHRRIVAIYRGWVIYSTGGNRNRACRMASFKRWLDRSEAELRYYRERVPGLIGWLAYCTIIAPRLYLRSYLEHRRLMRPQARRAT